MLRKHVKVENRRFYYWCDKLGILVWQDIPSTSGYISPEGEDMVRPEEEKEQFKQELKQMIHSKFNHPSIVVWVPFNEGWGQFETGTIVDLIKEYDDSRLVINASGWQDRNVGDIMDIHHYPDPRCPEPEETRAIVLGEFGGLGLYVEGHTWKTENWGYRKLTDAQSLALKYEAYYSTIWEMADKQGLSACVYTQITDVETETNGLMTYDREIIKIDPGILAKINTNKFVLLPPLSMPMTGFITQQMLP